MNNLTGWLFFHHPITNAKNPHLSFLLSIHMHSLGNLLCSLALDTIYIDLYKADTHISFSSLDFFFWASNSLLNINSWISNRHLKLNMSSIKLLTSVPNLFPFLPSSNIPGSHFHESLCMGLLAWNALPQQIQRDWCALNLCYKADFLSACLMLSCRAHLKCHLPKKSSLIASSGVGLPQASWFRIGLFASELIICVGKKEHIQWF